MTCEWHVFCLFSLSQAGKTAGKNQREAWQVCQRKATGFLWYTQYPS